MGDSNSKLDGWKEFPTKKRAIFDIVDSSRQYVFKGAFVAEGDNSKRVWKKVKDHFDFPCDK